MQVHVRVQRVGPVEVPLPSYQTSGSAGLDLCAALPEPVRLDDWYELPYGILGLETRQGRLVAAY